MVRKVRSFSLQELNLPIDDSRDTGAVGADLSYDFVGRPGYHHALATGQTEFLRLALTRLTPTPSPPAPRICCVTTATTTSPQPTPCSSS